MSSGEFSVSSGASRLVFDASGVTDWDSTLLTLVRHVLQAREERGLAPDRSGVLDAWGGIREATHFVGGVTIAFCRLRTGRARFPAADFLLQNVWRRSMRMRGSPAC